MFIIIALMACMLWMKFQVINQSTTWMLGPSRSLSTTCPRCNWWQELFWLSIGCFWLVFFFFFFCLFLLVFYEKGQWYLSLLVECFCVVVLMGMLWMWFDFQNECIRVWRSLLFILDAVYLILLYLFLVLVTCCGNYKLNLLSQNCIN